MGRGEKVGEKENLRLWGSKEGNKVFGWARLLFSQPILGLKNGRVVFLEQTVICTFQYKLINKVSKCERLKRAGFFFNKKKKVFLLRWSPSLPLPLPPLTPAV